MPETPDFDQIARVMLTRINLHAKPHGFDEEIKTAAEHLRQVWNARGAADLEAVNKNLVGTCAEGQHSDPDNSGQCIKCDVVLDYIEPEERAKELDRALRKLDR